mgnify:CR=1 FL=1
MTLNDFNDLWGTLYTALLMQTFTFAFPLVQVENIP